MRKDDAHSLRSVSLISPKSRGRGSERVEAALPSGKPKRLGLGPEPDREFRTGKAGAHVQRGSRERHALRLAFLAALLCAGRSMRQPFFSGRPARPSLLAPAQEFIEAFRRLRAKPLDQTALGIVFCPLSFSFRLSFSCSFSLSFLFLSLHRSTVSCLMLSSHYSTS